MEYTYKPDDYLPQVGDICEHEDNGVFIVTHLFGTGIGYKLGGYSYSPTKCRTLTTLPGSEARPGSVIIFKDDANYHSPPKSGDPKQGSVYTVTSIDADGTIYYGIPRNSEPGEYGIQPKDVLALVQEDEQPSVPEFEYPIYRYIGNSTSGQLVIKFTGLSEGTVVVAGKFYESGEHYTDWTKHTDPCWKPWNPQFDYDTVIAENIAVQKYLGLE